MNVKVKFLGGAKSVTGSRYLLEIGSLRVMVDCGLFQGLKELRVRNWHDFPTDPSTIDLILITHAHIDHTGYLPRLVKEGFKGRIIMTEPTVDLVKILLRDSEKLQEEEAAYALKKHIPNMKSQKLSTPFKMRRGCFPRWKLSPIKQKSPLPND